MSALSCGDPVHDFVASHLKEMKTVTIFSQSDSKYEVQRALLVGLSPWFGNALDGSFRESKEQTLRFPDTTTRTIGLCLYWLVKNKIPEDKSSRTGYAIRDDQGQLELVRLWIFADKHFITRLKNDTIRILVQGLKNNTLGYGTLREALEGSPQGSPLHRLTMYNLSVILHAKIQTPGCYEDTLPEDLEELADLPGIVVTLATLVGKNFQRKNLSEASFIAREGE